MIRAASGLEITGDLPGAQVQVHMIAFIDTPGQTPHPSAVAIPCGAEVPLLGLFFLETCVINSAAGRLLATIGTAVGACLRPHK